MYNLDNIETKTNALNVYLRMLICNASNVDYNDRGHIIKSTFRAILIHPHYNVRELFMCSRLISAVLSC